MHIQNPSESMTTEDVPVCGEIREITCELSLLTKPDGSCVLNQGDTSVMGAVYGPTEVRVNKEKLDRACVDVVYKPKVGIPGCAERTWEKLIRSSCESAIMVKLHPRTSINIIVQEMQNSGSLLSCSINASCMALLNAAVPLTYMVAAVSCVIEEDGTVILDPTHKQEKEAITFLTFVFSSDNYNILSCNTVGQCTPEQYQQCLLACREASKEVFKFYRASMEKQLLNVF